MIWVCHNLRFPRWGRASCICGWLCKLKRGDIHIFGSYLAPSLFKNRNCNKHQRLYIPDIILPHHSTLFIYTCSVSLYNRISSSCFYPFRNNDVLPPSHLNFIELKIKEFSFEGDHVIRPAPPTSIKIIIKIKKRRWWEIFLFFFLFFRSEINGGNNAMLACHYIVKLVKGKRKKEKKANEERKPSRKWGHYDLFDLK